MKIPILKITPDTAAEQVKDGWQLHRQRDFRGGETLAKLPEKVRRDQFAQMENAIISPTGEITESWQMDVPLFTNVETGLVLVPILGSRLYTVYAATEDGVIQFNADPLAGPYDLAAAADYPGYQLHAHASPVSITGLFRATPFLGKNFCAATDIFATSAQISCNHDPINCGSITVASNTTISVTLTNETASPITLNAVSFSGSVAFGQTGSFPQTLAPSGTYTFSVVYAPTVPGSDSATMRIATNIGVRQISVTGAATPVIEFVPSSIAFADTLVGSGRDHTLTIKNIGTFAVTIDSTGIFPAIIQGDFCITPVGYYIPPGGEVIANAYFHPTSKGLISADFSLGTSAGNISLPLSGTGI